MTWVVLDNPAYAGREPTPLKAACHDGSPCIDISCGWCGYVLHQHESVTSAIPLDAEIGSACHQCGELLVFPPGFFQRVFQKMRDDGWIA